MIIAEIESNKFGNIVVEKNSSSPENYSVSVNGKVTQPNHDAEGVIRYFANILQNT